MTDSVPKHRLLRTVIVGVPRWFYVMGIVGCLLLAWYALTHTTDDSFESTVDGWITFAGIVALYASLIFMLHRAYNEAENLQLDVPTNTGRVGPYFGSIDWFKHRGWIIALVLMTILLIGILGWVYLVHPDTPEERNDYLRTYGALIAGIAIIYQIRYTHESTTAAKKTLELSERGQRTETFYKATEQLGHESEFVQLGALHTLQSLHRDLDKDQDACFNTVQSFVADVSYNNDEDWTQKAPSFVHRTLAIIADMGLVWLSVSDSATKGPLQTSRYEQCRFNGAEITSGAFVNTLFYATQFVRSRFIGVKFENVAFNSARLDGAMFALCVFKDVRFNQAYLNDTMFSFPIIDDHETTLRILDLHDLGTTAFAKARGQLMSGEEDEQPPQLAARFEGIVEMRTGAMEMTHFEDCDLTNVVGLNWNTLDLACLNQRTKLPAYLSDIACVWKTRTSKDADIWKYGEVITNG